MKVETFIEKFEQIADAPNAISKMRELILQLAVRGRLVEQIASEGNADQLFSDITQARRDKSRNKPNGAKNCDSNIEPKQWHKIPTSWRWVLLGDLGDIVGGGTPRSDNPAFFADKGIPWLTPADLNGYKEKRIIRGRRFITQQGLENSSAQLLPEGTVLLSSRAPIGYVAIAGTPLATNQGFKSCIPYIAETNEYLYYFLMSAAARIDREAPGTTFREVSGKIVNQIPVPLPPLGEQKRIVAKVDELMVLCDRLESQQNERSMHHTALARAAVARFADAPTPANIESLFYSSYTITPDDIRKTIRTLAVQGKLVPQNLPDEPADQLIRRISIDREKIAQVQGLRLPKNVSDVNPDTVPHDIPDSWQWERIGRLAVLIDYGTSHKADSDYRNVPVYRMGNIVGGKLVEENMKYVDPTIDDLPGLYLKTNDILFNRTNSYELVGKSAVFRGASDTCTFASYLIRIRLPAANLDPSFFNLAMNAPYFRQSQIEPEITQQCGQANFNGTKLALTLVPVPPLDEQHRIVEKVDQLMALVDQLETQLESSVTVAAKLMDAAVAELVME